MTKYHSLECLHAFPAISSRVPHGLVCVCIVGPALLGGTGKKGKWKLASHQLKNWGR